MKKLLIILAFFGSVCGFVSHNVNAMVSMQKHRAFPISTYNDILALSNCFEGREHVITTKLATVLQVMLIQARQHDRVFSEDDAVKIFSYLGYIAQNSRVILKTKNVDEIKKILIDPGLQQHVFDIYLDYIYRTIETTGEKPEASDFFCAMVMNIYRSFDFFNSRIAPDIFPSWPACSLSK